MAKCKKCGAKSSIWSARGDGLCKDCGATADANAKQEAERIEAERKQRVYEDSKNNVARIVKALASEQALCYSFINRNITEKKSSGLLGVVVGGALGGMAGAMMGNCLAGGSSCSYLGDLGIVVVTQTQVIIGYFAAPFLTADGNISSDHLDLFRTKLESNAVSLKSFNIRRTQVTQAAESTVNLVCGLEAFSFCKSKL